MKKILLLLTLSYLLFGNEIEELKVLQYKGVDVTHNQLNGKSEEFIIKRERDFICLNIPISNDMIWEGDYANRTVPTRCKTTLIKTAGQIQPMNIHPLIKTFGELEVLKFIDEKEFNSELLLIDTRGEHWFEYRTIPSAINIPYYVITKSKKYKKEFKKALLILGIKKDFKNKKYRYNFNKAKTITLFCNGSWCGQSPAMIKTLLLMGYPANKIKWYRGGMDDWLGMNMTSTRP
ncbi:hypothetical protein MNB_SV-9-116 [hydrothermal vent metagenome]|uniref:Rhodanese domain-containing protein n=1 Tax=hydrothermal vent metagenome TaxID=652676 RepID=A0A1W1BRW6_9ZZZZ